ncbi:MAG: 4-hydroxybenzoate synthetase [Candidatus Cohnella colombiensis]|uniref:4-hydroxybenzoate synthetase n=1 Tax=Candidatus Cohnella colombiensis TaxID=3121368 RepID=A0AA95EXS7_9BACL|nr:MAG: 4-hydroxybenzoate synthetase [Cohnella sp.]
MISEDSNDGICRFEELHHLLFELLMKTDGRTTDMLEALVGEKVKVEVILQRQIESADAIGFPGLTGEPYYVRESILISELSGCVVSHNIVLVCAAHVPRKMFEALALKQEGIGKTIIAHGLPTSRKLIDYGWREQTAINDLFQQPLELKFSTSVTRVPFKQYAIYFESEPGIYLLEYFNPDIVSLRLGQAPQVDQPDGA